MERFPSDKSVGDLLASGVYIEPEQEALLDAPGGRPMMAVWGVPDPISESGQAWWIKGEPVLIPVPILNCTPYEPYELGRGLKVPLSEMLFGSDRDRDYVMEMFVDPVVVAEVDETGDMPYRIGDYEVVEEHYARQLYDLWPIDERDVRALHDAIYGAIESSGYLQLVDYFNWENGNYEPESQTEIDAVSAVVLDRDGSVKDPDSFDFRLHLPRELAYTWERLQDVSQQGWVSSGLALPPVERDRFFKMRGNTPWF